MKDLRRFALNIDDSQGRRQPGEIVLARHWREEWGKGPLPEGLSFLIVMLEQPPEKMPLITSTRVAVCLPQEAVTVPPAVREPRASYAADVSDAAQAEEDLFSLPVSVIASFSRGQIIASEPFEVRPQQVFDPEQQRVQVEVLVRTLLERSPFGRRPPAFGEPYLHAIASALVAPHEPGIESADAAIALARLRRLVTKAEETLRKGGERGVALPAPLSRLRLVAGKEKTEVPAPYPAYGDPLDLAEDIFFCRCLLNDREAALELAAMRAYLEEAVVPASVEQLAMDRRVTLEQLSNASLLFEPHRLEAMRGTFEFFRKRYSSAYSLHHSRSCQTSEKLLRELRELEAHAAALRRLNQLRELGKPLGLEALDAYEQAQERLQPCPVENALTDSLRQSPFCPMCHLTLADQPAVQQPQRIAARLHKALGQQQTRLAKRIIRQILSIHGEKRIEQFLKIVQATQLRGIAEVLDDDLIAFLRELLAQDQGSEENVLEKFSRSFPAVTEESLDVAVEGFRRLLEETLAEEKRRNRPMSPLVELREDEGTAPGRGR